MSAGRSSAEPLTARVLPRAFYDRPVAAVARDLLGKLLVRAGAQGRAVGRIVEAEAYLAAGDAASHSFRGRTRRNASMFGPPGHAYVYAIHSRWCLNTVTEPEGVASAVLIRALEPLAGIELMRRRRSVRRGNGADASEPAARDLARGPARLCEALDIDRALDGWDLTRGTRLWIAAEPDFVLPSSAIGCGRRIGVTSACDLPLRFWIAGSPFVSRG